MTVDKRCELNRYCGFVGPFAPQHIVELGHSRPQVVGRCLECGAYVCNRCADRKPIGSPRAFAGAELLCPLDGQSLGRGEEWLTFHAEFARMVRSTGYPGIDTLVQAMAGSADSPVDPATARARAMVLQATVLENDGRREEAIAQCREALAIVPDFALARFVRQRILGSCGRHAEALDDWRALLALPVDVLSRALSDDDWLAQQSVDAAVGVPEISRVIAAAAQRAGRPAIALLPVNPRVSPPWIRETPMKFPSSSSVPATATHGHACSLVSALHGTIVAEYCPTGASRTLLVLCHEPDIKTQQSLLFGQLEHLYAAAPDVPVLTEGLTARAPRTRGMRSVDERRAAATRAIEGGQSASFCALQLFPKNGWLNPADDPSLLERQEATRARIESAVRGFARAGGMPLDSTLLTCSLVAAAIEEPLRGSDTQQLWQLRRNYEQNGQAVLYLEAIAPFLRRAGISLSEYHGLHALTRMAQYERTLDFNRIEHQRMELVNQLAELSGRRPPAELLARLDAWCDAGSTLERPLTERYDGFLRSALGVADKPGQRPGFLARMFGTHAPPRPDLGVPEWFVRVLVLSKAYSEGLVPNSAYNARLQSLLGALEIPATEPLRSYFEYIQLEPQVDTSTIHHVEIPQLDAALRQALAASLAEYRALQIMTGTEELVRLLNLTLPAAIVRRVIGGGGLTPIAADLDRLHAYAPPGSSAELDLWETSRSMVADAAHLVDNVLPDVATFYELAFQRSRSMARAAVQAAHTSSISVLVCGRFHVPEVERAVRESHDVSLVVVAPFPVRPPTAGPARRLTWVHPHREEPGRPLQSNAST